MNEAWIEKHHGGWAAMTFGGCTLHRCATEAEAQAFVDGYNLAMERMPDPESVCW